MAPFRNPFNKKPPVTNGIGIVNDENARPALGITKDSESHSSHPASRTSSSLSIKKKEDPGEYKLSVVNDSGVYLPPSPPEKKSWWASRSPNSALPSNHRNMLNENEPFSISRESFESYRRSFDISARSPVHQYDNTSSTRGSMDARKSMDTRTSLDSKLASPGRQRKSDQFERPEPTDEEPAFEDIGLNDDVKQAPKKRGIFSRFGDSSEPPVSADAPRPTSSHRGFHLPGRKRGQSGQGAELGNIERPSANGEDDGVVR